MKIGIVGAGSMGVAHAASWARTDATLTGVLAQTPANAGALAAQFGARVYSSLAALLADVDVVDICSPTPAHYEMALQAAAAGKHIVCEKPLARTTRQAREMLAACHAAGAQLLVAHVVRYFPEYGLAKNRVLRGEVGKVGLIRLSRRSARPLKPADNWFFNEEMSGGVLMDLMIHDYDFARWVAGDVASVHARKVATHYPDAQTDYGIVTLKHRGGAISHVTGTWAYPPPGFRTRIEITGDAGHIEFDSADRASIAKKMALEAGLPSSAPPESPYTAQIKEFYAVLRGLAQPRVSAEDGLAAVQIAEAALESARLGKEVDV